MGSIVNTEYIRLNTEYAELRARIVHHYEDALALVGASVHKSAYNLPKRLGNWRPEHADLVRSYCPELGWLVQRIERLVERREPGRIKAQHIASNRAANFRHRGSSSKAQLNPGEWPPRYK